MPHTIISPEGHREPIMPSDALFELTHDLLTLFHKYGPEWTRLAFKVNRFPDANWRYECDFDYDASPRPA
jgi:hypothetical protein